MKKLKKLRIKLRVWIIHKLGGFIQSEIPAPRIVAQTEYHPVTLMAKYMIPTDAIYRAEEPELSKQIKQKLCSMLSYELIKHIGTLVEIRSEENRLMGTTEFTVFLRALEKRGETNGEQNDHRSP